MDFEGKQQSLLTFRVGPVLCCAPSLPVRSIITPPKLTHPPGSDSSQPGIFKHGSHIVKVLDLRQKFGIDEAEQTQPGNLIITIFEKESFAFWVDKILDVFDFPSEGWGNLPAAIPRGVFTRTLLLNKKIHLYSEFEKLATIQDLGYLKHYIQQLKEQSDKKTEQGKVDNPSSLASSNRENEPNKEVISTLSAENKSIVQPSSSMHTHSQGTHSKQTSTRKPLPISTPDKKIDKPVERRITSHPLTQHNTKLEKSSPDKIAPIAAQNTVVKSTYIQPKRDKNASVINSAEPITSTLKTQFTTQTKKPETHTSQTQVNKEQVDIEESSSTGIIIFFLFILGLLGTGLYFLLPEKVTTISKYENNAELIYQPTSQEYYEAPETKIEKKSIEEEFVNDISIDEKLKIETLPNNTIIEEPITENNLKEELSYRADISKQDNEITITLHQPLSSVETTIEKEAIVEQKIESEIKEETVIDIKPIKPLNVDKLSPPRTNEKIISEVIHTVVKGDTLWAIAKKYVNNPFLYPELARLSNIKNPHRIYPGNRVRIRFIK